MTTSGSAPEPGSTELTRLRRLPQKSVGERAVLYDILDASLIAHVGICDQAAQPFVLPVGYARSADTVLFHGSSGSRLFRALAAGASTCFTVTRHDGMVLARSGFESSILFRCAMVFGTCRVVDGPDKLDALRLITEHLLPGRWPDIRPPSTKELAATTVLELPLTECSVKVGASGPSAEDEAQDIASPIYGRIWAGIVPMAESFGTPVADTHAAGIPVPDYLTDWRRD